MPIFTIDIWEFPYAFLTEQGIYQFLFAFESIAVFLQNMLLANFGEHSEFEELVAITAPGS